MGRSSGYGLLKPRTRRRVRQALGVAVSFAMAIVFAVVGVPTVTPPPNADAAPPTGTPLNPVSGNQGFLVFAQGNATLNYQDSEGPVALGGDLTLSQTNFALGRTITASSSASGQPPLYADDGNVQTYWQSATGAFPQTLTVDLGSTRTIAQVVLRLPAAFSTRTQTLSVLGSTTGTSFTTLVASNTYTFNPATGNAATINFSPVSARYVRLSITANSAVAAGQISEFEVGRPISGGGNVYQAATETAGTFTAPGDARPTGLLIGGRMNWAGSAGNGYLYVRSNGYVKLGDLTGTSISQGGGTSTHLVVSGGTYNSQPGIALDLAQPTGSVNQSGLIDFTGAFAAFRTRSTDLASCDNTVVLRDSGGTPLPPTLPAGTNAYITLTTGVQNVLNITAANLANISTLTFTNHPSGTTPLVVNVNTSGVGDDFSWRPPSPNGLNDADARFILWNFSTGVRLSVVGSSPVRGTIYAPSAGVFQYDSSGVYGGVIASSYSQGGPYGSPAGGTVRNFPFGTSVQTCAAGLALEKTANVTSTVPGGTVRYQITASNVGGSTLTGATFTDALAGLLDDATYNNDAAATTGSVNVVGSNLTWTGNLIAGAAASITYSVTVNSPDTGNHRLVDTVTSTTPNNNCPSGGTDPRCSTDTPVADLVIDKSADVSTVLQGGTVNYTVTVTNAGQTAYNGISVVDNLSGVLDDAAYDDNASATSGTVTFASPNLTWTGNLAVGAEVTITYSATVDNPDTGDRSLVNVLTSTATANNCAPASSDARCRETVVVQVPGLTIAKTADATTTTHGSVVNYTLTITNTGETPYTGASVTDSLAGVLDDADYNNDAAASAGSVSFTSPNLVWTGNLAVGAPAVTVTYSVTVLDTEAGNHALTNTVTTSAAGSNCGAGSTDPRCTVTVPVADLNIQVASDPSTSTTPGSVVRFNVTITNVGQVPYTGATVLFPLAGLTDDATPNGDQTATSGTLTLTATDVQWVGDVPVGGSVFITGTVTVNDPDTGNRLIEVSAVSTATGNNCPSGSTDPTCSVALPVLVNELTITKAADTATTVQGGTVNYTVTITNDGTIAYTGAEVADDLSGVLDDAAYNNDASASAGNVSYSAPTLTWTGNLAVSASVTVTYSVTVDDPDTGDKVMVNRVTSTDAGSSCPPAGGNAGCTSNVAVLIPGLTITKTADTATATPGSVVNYTVTVVNSGQLPYTGAQLTDSLSGVLDDATYNNDATASVGTVVFSSPNLTWTGSLAPGADATVQYSVTVRNPDPGSGQLTNTVTSTEAGNNCHTGNADPRCTTTVTVVQATTLTFTKRANVTEATFDQIITYTVTATNSGSLPYLGATFTDNLAGALDDADYNHDASAPSGVLTYVAPNLTWVGTVPAHGSVTITYTMTVHSDVDVGGDYELVNVVSSLSLGNNCGLGSTDPRCTVTIGVTDLDFVLTSVPSTSTTPGSVVRFNVTITNEGGVPYTGVTASFPLAGIDDDATANGDQTATSGTLTVTPTAVEWTGDVPIDGTVSITGTVTVNDPDTGNRLIEARVISAATGSSCPSGSADPDCAIALPVLVNELTITKEADTATTVQGGTVGYTVTITNDGTIAYTGAEVADDLAGVLDDAAYNDDASASAGTVSYSAPTLTWTGNLAVSASVTVTYSVTVDDPDTGDKVMVNRVTSTEAGSTCPPASGNPACTSNVVVLIPALTITKTADTATATPGSVVNYTVTVVNSGQLPYTGAQVADNLTGVLDDAAYNDDASATAGAVVFSTPTLTWTGNLAVGASATVTYSVTVDNPDTGDGQLTNVVSSTEAGNNCPTLSTDPRCTTSIPVSILVIDYTTDVATTTPGGLIGYTVTITNSGQTPYFGSSVNFSLAGLIDDARYNGDGTVTSGAIRLDLPGLQLVWSGDVPIGGSVTVRASATVNDPDTGDHDVTSVASSQAVGNNCPTSSTDPRCTTSVQVLIPGLTITKAANVASTTPGGTVDYTITVDNSGETAYTGAVATDQLADLLDDAAYNDDAVATIGTVELVGTALIWTGDLAVGQSSTITYSVTVDDPDTGDRNLINTVTSDEAGSTCPTGGPGDDCTVVLGVLLPQLTIVKSANVTGVTAGATVTYTISLTNTGETAYTGISADDDLTGVLDDATYNDDAAASAGSVSYAAPTLTWTGDLALGATVTITYTVTVDDPDTGDHTMLNTVTSAAQGSTCPVGGAGVDCTAQVQVLTTVLDINISADAASIVEGGTVQYTITLANNGESPYADLTVTNSLAGVVDDAVYNDDAITDIGSVQFTSPNLVWSGNLDVGQTATITYTVTVDVPSAGDRSLVNVVTSTAPGSSCPPPGTATGCTATTTIEELTLTLSELTPSFTLSGTPDSTAEEIGAVTMRVTTNSPTGYQVTVQATQPTLAAETPGNTHSIPIGNLRARETGTATYHALSNASSVLLYSQSTPSAPGGDVLSNDYAVSIPLTVTTDSYSGDLTYVAMTP